MKKIISFTIVVLIVLSFVGCGAKETTKTEEELKAEIRAELEAEAEKEKNATEVEKISIDLKDKNLLLDFLCENFHIGMDKSMLIDDIQTVYGDFNGDGNDDVACYSPNRNSFYEVAFITVDHGELSLIPSEIDKETIYTHNIAFDGKFIHYTITGGGTGISVTLKRLYAYNGDTIMNTGAEFILEGYEAQPPTSNYPDGYMTETTSNTLFDVEGDYSSFVHEVITTGSSEKTEKKAYVYNPDTYKFTITDL
ncbi:hypothetical protein [Crassaminicella profunda]|uniref:hypothetical protein n=1 Tax=Crassaminicella profunda TaxID=1286698 RepID=UPI001CA65424|nr:hypothetical protein [Crassaminicella profunda]QZY56132.1 hypothetical protein K7H06_03780 [Crassaminicella profunda]